MIQPEPEPSEALEQTLLRVLELARDAIPFDKGAIHLIRDGRLVTRAAWCAPSFETPDALVGRTIPEESFCAHVARRAEPLVVNDIATESRVRPANYTGVNRDIQAFMGVPIRRNGEVIGVLELDSTRRDFFTEQHLALARLAVGQASLAIENARRYRTADLLRAQLRRTLEEMIAIHRAGLEMALERDPDRLIEDICTRARELVGGFGALLHLADEPSGLQGDTVKGCFEELPDLAPLHALLIAPALESGRAQSHALNSETVRALRKLPGLGDLTAAATVPLRLRDRLIGALAVVGEAPVEEFDAYQVQLIGLFGAQAAVLLDNTRLLELARERQRELEALTAYNTLLVESSPVGIAVVDERRRFIRANPAFCAIIGREWAQIDGLTIGELLETDTSDSLVRLVRATLDDGKARRLDGAHYAGLREGSSWFDWRVSPLRDNEGRSRAVMLTLSDVTDARELERSLRAQNERIERQLTQLRALYEIGTQINAALDMQRVIEALLTNVRQIFAVDGMTMLMPDDEGDEFHFVSGLGLSDRFLRAEQRHQATSPAALAVRQRAPILILDVDGDPRIDGLREAALEEGLASALFVPLVHREEVLALLSLYHRSPRKYSAEQLELLSIFINQATSAIKNAQLYSSISHSQGNLDATLRSMTDGVLALDNHDRVIFINAPLFEMVGLEPHRDWQGRPLAELPAAIRALVDRLVDAPLSREGGRDVQRLEVELPTPARTLDLIEAPILDEEGLRVGRLLLLHDITEIRASERFKDEMISILGHELRTPLTSILGYSKLLVDRSDSKPEKRQRWARHILEKSRLLSRLVNEVLDLSRYNLVALEPKEELVEIAPLVDRVVALAELQSEAHPVVTEMSGDLEGVWLDPARIEQLLTNLLVNAVKYSPDGGEIRLEVHGERDWIEFAVSDEGLGIEPEHLDRIWEPFYRIDNSTTRSVYGTGLGLPLCRGIVEMHGGELTVESTPGEGSTFRARLPRAPIHAARSGN